MRARFLVPGLVVAAATVVGGPPPAAQDAPSAIVTDEVIVRGRTAEGLRLEIERAENAVFERFNAINSHDDFDIYCTLEVRTGTRIPQRECAPVFLRNAQATAGRDVVRSLQGSAYGSGTEALQAGMAAQRQILLEQELRRLVTEDQALVAALERLIELQDSAARPRARKRDER
jgi:hypothetical protein